MQNTILKTKLCSIMRDRVNAIMICFTVIFFIGIILSVVLPVKYISGVDMNVGASIPCGELYDDQTIEMHFDAAKSGFQGIAFSFATYGRVLTEGTLIITMVDEDQKEIFHNEYKGSSIRDNSVIDIQFPEQSKSKDREYVIRFYTKGIDINHSLAIWGNGSTVKGCSTFLNGKLQPAALVFSVTYDTNTYRYTWDLSLLFSVFVVLTIVSLGRSRENK